MEDETEGAVVLERRAAKGPFVFVCEHAVNAFPARWGDLGLTASQRHAHVAWDPGALGLARALSVQLESPLVRATTSRLIYDLNRPPQSASAMPARSELHDIPGNADLSAKERLDRTQALYLPFHAELRMLLAEKLALGQRPILVTVHSFTPVYYGRPRDVELGIIHDADPALACAVLEEARAQTRLDSRLNEPYSAADEVTHTLALQATPLGLMNVMLELRNDLLPDAAAQKAMASLLAPVLQAALARIQKPLEVV
ncbi:putative N-formylglutamate amidohydrolase [Rhodobacter aestuarii]|uniref:Predicted N-formylglutamate amidohydrolase n=1 Tax=Rhodobacter aestuarii TaxID=453582 RepID=A0A1N7PAJ5_9RHOB|nr:N-formylglutamate amidohydrolase [Rhodobacter aestuarii]PTV97703.1 putative N-formylglutamate amidohydrolase [Rhodobacter aestuarii]SIT07560.1 Predicted N-formylglutamate amidohydrolase [Rhodobacter aestuarii]